MHPVIDQQSGNKMFNEFPPGLILLVTEHLDRPSFVAFASTSKVMYNFLGTHLYAFIESHCSCAKTYKGLVFTLLRHPELARSVRHLKIGRVYDSDPIANGPHMHEICKGHDGDRLMMSKVRRFSSSEKEYWE
ncbi:hypothetical protein N7532_001597 [Penicillium argentinense]|uniref:F-box domain-containing protein n=1 Tax=Penicillium argentinense TaxID=1131581 RepID=A0A9W9KMN1_9EURO|nr:uncharacterized protein N7532_001597 [Penicillium argentinense]KAJ5111062.1 hypothetical protein N7532_001597 [Penicillium argentinense]